MAPSREKTLLKQIATLRAALKAVRERKKKLTPKQLREVKRDEQLIAEFVKTGRKEAKEAMWKKKALLAANKFRPRKSDRGRLIFIDLQGKRSSSNSKRGFLVKVAAKSGKTRLQRSKKHGYKPLRKSSVEIPISKAGQNYIESKKARNLAGKSIVKGRVTVDKIKGAYDFNDAIVDKLAAGLKRVIERQASHRNFAIEAMVLVELQDGQTRVYNFNVPIAKADHIAIEVAGMVNFIRHVFYAHLAQQLAFDGYVTSGSANHIRRLPENAGKDRSEWTKGAFQWQANEYDQVKIRTIEWRIVQLL